jgi:hypothetical protein
VTVDARTELVDWPAALSSYVADGRLRFPTKGPHPFVTVAVPFALVLGGMGVAGLAGVGDRGVVAFIAALAAMAFAIAVLMSVAYTSWGSMEIERRGPDWIVTRSLGRLRSASVFAAGGIRSAVIYSPPPFVIFWPGSAGLHVRVHVANRERPVEVGAGLRLDGATLQALQALFTPNP